MLAVTPAAVNYLALLLERSEAEGNQSVRLVSVPDGTLGLLLDQVEDEDEVIPDGERPVLVIEPDLANALAGAMLDSVETTNGERLVLTGVVS